MIKKLSEIGHRLETGFAHMTYEGNFVKQRDRVEVVMTLDERRELVRGSIKKFLVGHMLEWRLKCELSTALDKFCEEQGI